MSAPTRTPRRWMPRVPKRVIGPFTEGNLLRWVIGAGLGAFALGYLVVTLLFFPGFGRSAIVAVPDLRGHPWAQARAEMRDLGLEIRRGGELPNPRVRAGAVLVQSPLPGQEVTRGAEVTVVLSSGPVRYRVPTITGQSLREARTTLERFGFQVAVQNVVSDEEEGSFVAMRPAAGTLAVVPSVVTILVSAGPPKLLVPSVVSLPLDDAEARLRAAGFRLGRVQYDPSSAEPLGGVAAQRPAAGDSLRRGGAVGVTVSGNDPNPPPPPAPAPDSADARPDETQPPPPQEFPQTSAPPVPPAPPVR